MASKQDYLARIQVAIQQLHKCGAVHRRTVPVKEVFRGKTIWQGDVEVFDINGHAKAKRCYGWSHVEGNDDKGERFVTVLEIPPVSSPATAVKVAIVTEVRAAQK